MSLLHRGVPVWVWTALTATGLLMSSSRALAISYTFESFRYQGTSISFATGINNVGQVVGSTGEVEGVDVVGGGFLRDSGNYSLLLFDGLYSAAYGINNRGVVVGTTGMGWSYLYDSTKWTYSSFQRDGAHGINDLGQVVGTSKNGAWFYNGSSFETISYPGAPSTRAEGLNNKGQIVGSYGVPGISTCGFLFESGTFASICVPGSRSTEALGINNLGEIVGYYSDWTGWHGFLDRHGYFTTIDVPEANSFPESSLTMAASINDYGVIAGSWQNWDGQTHAYVAIPTPEPGSVCLLGMGVMTLVGMVRARRRNI